MLALVLTDMAVATVTHSQTAVDTAISASVQSRLSDLQPIAAAASPVLSRGSRDSA